MSEPPRRKRFQIHLSTAIVMMFVAGLLLWMNTRGSEVYIKSLKTADASYAKWGADVFGWPFDAMTRLQQHDLPIYDRVRIYNHTNLCVDGAVALAILLAVWLLCEWLIRRRAARKGS